jgi:hypothetical protein
MALPSTLTNVLLGQSSKLNGLAITLHQLPTSPTILTVHLFSNWPSQPSSNNFNTLFGFVNFYKEFWQHRARIMVPLTKLSLSNTKLRQHWATHHKQVFEDTKLMIALHVLLNHAPDPNLSYDLKPNASNYQLGSIIK